MSLLLWCIGFFIGGCVKNLTGVMIQAYPARRCGMWRWGLKALFDSGLLQDSVGGVFRDDSHGDGKTFSGNWALPYFLASSAINNKTTAQKLHTDVQCDIVWKLGKPVYVFICSEGFSYHEYSTYGEEEYNFQQLHRID